MTASLLSRRRMLIQSAGAALALTGCHGRSSRGSGRPEWACSILRRRPEPSYA
jgi:hypothetical protein